MKYDSWHLNYHQLSSTIMSREGLKNLASSEAQKARVSILRFFRALQTSQVLHNSIHTYIHTFIPRPQVFKQQQ